MGFLGGSFVSVDNLPKTMQTIAHFTPFYWATAGYRTLLKKGGGLADVLPAIAVLSILGVVLLLGGHVLPEEDGGARGSGGVRKVLALAINDLRLTVRDRASFFWLLVLPIGLMGFFGMFGGGGGDSKARLTVVDEDKGWLARAFVSQIAGQQIEVVEAKPGERKVRTLVFPRASRKACSPAGSRRSRSRRTRTPTANSPWRSRPPCSAPSRPLWPDSWR